MRFVFLECREREAESKEQCHDLVTSNYFSILDFFIHNSKTKILTASGYVLSLRLERKCLPN